MENFEIMQCFESPGDLDENIPDFSFVKIAFFLFILDDLLIKVSSVCELHNHASLHCGYHRFLPSRKASL